MTKMPSPIPGSAPVFKPVNSPAEKCRNCRNAVGSDGHAVKADDGHVYCSKNCYWSYYVRKGSSSTSERDAKRQKSTS